MPSKLSGISSRSTKEREAKAEEAAHQSHGGGPSELLPHYSPLEIPPPDYEAGSSSDYADASPNYISGFANLDLSDAPSSENPAVDETIAHLKTLECFYREEKLSLLRTGSSVSIMLPIWTSLARQAWPTARELMSCS